MYGHMGTTHIRIHSKGRMLGFTTFVHIYIFLWEPIVHGHSGSK